LPVYQQLAATIRTSIVDGELTAGQRLPAEIALAHAHGVSRSTVREAPRVLQESGFIERSSPRIFVVRAHDEAFAARALANVLRQRTVTFAALHETLMLLEPELSRLAALRREESDLERLRANLAEQRRSRRDFHRWCRIDEQFHVVVAEAAANAPLLIARATIGSMLTPAVEQIVTDEHATATGIDFHQRIYDAILEGDPDLAALMARRHVEDFQAAWERSGLANDRDVSADTET
jgi:DNA-binding FadR family transcriptional regulator